MTVRKNTLRARAVLAAAVNCRVYTLGNHFVGEACAPTCAAAELARWNFAKLRHNGGSGYTVHVHSNLWYSFESLPA